MLTKSAALFAVLLVVIGMAAFISAKPAYALEIKDRMYVDLSEGPATYTGADAAMLNRFMDVMVEEKGYGISTSDTGDYMRYRIDMNMDMAPEFIFAITYKNGIAEKAEISRTETIETEHLSIALAEDDRNEYEPMGTDNQYGLSYFCMELDFVFDRSRASKPIKEFTFDLSSGTATFIGEEAFAVVRFLDNVGTDFTDQPLINIHIIGDAPYYDIDRDGVDDFYLKMYAEDDEGKLLTVFEKTADCSVKGAKKINLPKFLDDDYYYGFIGQGEEPYYYQSMTFLMDLTPIDNAKVTLSKTKFTYNGKKQKPAIRTIGGKALKKDTDYTVTWPSSPVKVGTYTITITGKGMYSGTTKVTYQIVQAANPLLVKAKKATVKANDLKKGNKTLAVDKVIKTKKKGKGKITYSKVSGNGKIKINKKNGKVTIKKGLKAGTYKVTVKVKAAGDRNYKAKTKKVTFKIVVK